MMRERVERFVAELAGARLQLLHLALHLRQFVLQRLGAAAHGFDVEERHRVRGQPLFGLGQQRLPLGALRGEICLLLAQRGQARDLEPVAHDLLYVDGGFVLFAIGSADAERAHAACDVDRRVRQTGA